MSDIESRLSELCQSSREKMVDQHTQIATEVYHLALRRVVEQHPIASEMLIREVALRVMSTAHDLAHAGDAYRGVVHKPK